MTPLSLLQELTKIQKEIFADFHVENGEKIHVFEYYPRRHIEAEDYSIYPYSYAFLGDGSDNNSGESNQDAVIVVVAYDDSGNNKGAEDVMNAIGRIRAYLSEYPDLCSSIIEDSETSAFTIKRPVRWIMPQGDEYFPLYVGAVLITAEIPQINQILPYV